MKNEAISNDGSLSIFPNESAFSALWRNRQRLAKTSSLDSRNFNRYVHSQLPSDLESQPFMLGNTTDHIVQAHTNWPLYNLTLGDNLGRLLKQAMLNRTPISDIVRIARLPSSKDGAVSHFRLCPECHSEDIANKGVAYFHIEHQLPGVVSCYTHHRLLMRFSKKSDAFKALFQSRRIAVTPTSNEAQRKFAYFIHMLFSGLSDRNNQICLHDVIRHGLADNNYLYSAKRVDDHRFAKHFQWYLNELKIDVDFQINGIASRFYHYQQQYPCAPLKAMLILSFLFHDTLALFRPLSSVRNVRPQLTHGANQNEEARIIASLQKGLSISRTARSAGRSRCFVKRIARQNGLIDGIEQFLGKGIYCKARQLALAGEHTTKIALALGISKGAAERVISEDRLVKAIRSIRRLQQLKQAHRQSLLITLDTVGKKAIREHIKTANYAAYYWLFEHDKAWLESHVMPPTIPQNPASRAKRNADPTFD